MSNYEKRPFVAIDSDPLLCHTGWPELFNALRPRILGGHRRVVVVETYPGVDQEQLIGQFASELSPSLILQSQDAFLTPAELRQKFADTLRNDPVFDVMHPWVIEDYFDQQKLGPMKQAVEASSGLVLIVGTGASRIAPGANLMLSANLGRWEIQRRQRVHRIANLGFDNEGASASQLYKTAFFLDWRVADRCRHDIYPRVDFFLDMTDESQPKMLAGDILRAAVKRTVRQPFRVVPFFDPGPWGGQWMRDKFSLPEGPPNYAWGFDCVPEENSVLFAFRDRRFELPAIVLVHEEPEALLGSTIVARFGAEFPIRFDFLDTVGGGNLSLQVHPSDSYIRDHFGMAYTQDESYYMLHCEPGTSMFLGLKESADREAMTAALYEANEGGRSFPAEEFVAMWPTATHDHFSIPAGTIHCSGEGSVVLEISATPYIFTFKLWDWDRTGLDGRPRPIHLEHGLENISWERTAEWVRAELVDQTREVNSGEGWREEHTGLHASQFLETRRHWFTNAVDHYTKGNLNVLNLVEGEEVVVSSPDGAFDPMIVHYAETFIIPACVGAYTISPLKPAHKPFATLKAYVRP